jgi:hypothetical protein
MTALERAVGSLARFLEEREVPYMIIGGIANLVWGEPRSTLDVDASVLVEEPAWPGLVTALRKHFRVLPKDALAFLRETHVLPIETADGVRIDLVWARLPYEHKAIARATIEEVAGHPVRVCRPEDLIISKIVSERPKDREDVRAIVRHQGSRLDRRYLSQIVRSLARALDQPELLTFLNSCFRGKGASGASGD